MVGNLVEWKNDAKFSLIPTDSIKVIAIFANILNNLILPGKNNERW